MNHFFVYSDGGSRGNPGPAGCGFVILDDKKKEISNGNKFLDIMTNNQAEYSGVVAALEEIVKLLNDQTDKENTHVVEFFLDSQLIVEQMNGRYKIKNEGLKPLFWKIRELIMDLGGNVTFEHVPREENKEADRLVNEAIDKGTK